MLQFYLRNWQCWICFTGPTEINSVGILKSSKQLETLNVPDEIKRFECRSKLIPYSISQCTAVHKFWPLRLHRLIAVMRVIGWISNGSQRYKQWCNVDLEMLSGMLCVDVSFVTAIPPTMITAAPPTTAIPITPSETKKHQIDSSWPFYWRRNEAADLNHALGSNWGSTWPSLFFGSGQ